MTEPAKTRKKSKKSLQSTFDVVRQNSSDEYEIDAQYQALPNSKKTDESEKLKAKIDELEVAVNRAEQAKTSAEQKYQDLSYRVDELEELIDRKNERISTLENGQEGYVMVEEDLLHHVETSFANFQGN